MVEVEAGGHVELEAAVGVDVGPEQRGECALFVRSDAVPSEFFERLLGRVFRSATGEASKDRFGVGDAEA